MDAGLIILVLKLAVVVVTLLWIGSLVALAMGRTRLHGRINILFFVLTLAALLGLELITNVISPGLLDDFLEARDARTMLRVHLCFSMPAALLLFVMLFTGLRHQRRFHIAAGVVFGALWTGTFITGIFFLPHQ